jgi:Tol biopolymer transport system component
VLKALRKEPERRYGSAAELSEDLERFLQDLPVEARRESLLYRGRKFLRRRRGPLTAAAVTAVTVVAVVMGMERVGLNRPALKPFQDMRMTRLTTDGKAGQAAFSPKGDYVAYSHKEEDGRQSLWVRNIASSSSVQILPPAQVDYGNLAFSADGNDIYFTSLESYQLQKANLYKVPAVGGVARKLRTVDWADLITWWTSALAVSPDGEHLAFISAVKDKDNDYEMLVTGPDGTYEHTLALRPENEMITGAAWSADGHTIALTTMGLTGVSRTRLVTLAAEGGRERTVIDLDQKFFSVKTPVWLQDSWLAVISPGALDEFGGQIWRISRRSGTLERITHDLNTYIGLTVPKPGSPITSVQRDHVCNLWISPSGQSDAARQITFESNKYEGIHGISWTPNGTIFFGSRSDDGGTMWQIKADGRDLKQFRSVLEGWSVAVSPDGKSVAFVSFRDGVRRIWKADADGSNAVPVTEGRENAWFPSWSSDGQWLLYTAFTSLQRSWKRHLAGGAPVLITPQTSWRPAVSPDGKWIVCLLGDKDPKIGILSFIDGHVDREFDTPRGLTEFSPLLWTPDGKAIAYIADRGGVSNIFAQPLGGGKPIQITKFTSGSMFSFAWSRDGSQLACARGGVTSDVVLIHNQP